MTMHIATVKKFYLRFQFGLTFFILAGAKDLNFGHRQ